MTRSNSISRVGQAIKNTVLPWVLPRIVELEPGEWDTFIERARATNFDLIEKAGVLAGVAFVTYLLRFDSGLIEGISLPLQFTIQFVAAVPLLILFAGPFYLRRLRRGLDQEIELRRLAGNFDRTRRCNHDQN